MNLQQLKYACALADCGSFVQAANLCAVTQPTLSNAIALLEEELGHKLFARTTRTVELTKAGALLIPDIREILNAKAALTARASALAHPTQRLIRVGVSPVIGVKFVNLVIEPFRMSNPDIEIVFRELNLTEMAAMLESGQLDFVLGPVDPGAKPKDGFESSVFQNEPLVFVPSSPTRNSYASSKNILLADIACETLVMVPDACGLTKVTRAVFQQARLPLREYSGQAMSYAVLQEWAELGIGGAILPRSKLIAGTQSALSIVTERNDPVMISYQCLWRVRTPTIDHVQILASFMRDIAPSIVRGMNPNV